jgi:hypothetical protein
MATSLPGGLGCGERLRLAALGPGLGASALGGLYHHIAGDRRARAGTAGAERARDCQQADLLGEQRPDHPPHPYPLGSLQHSSARVSDVKNSARECRVLTFPAKGRARNAYPPFELDSKHNSLGSVLLVLRFQKTTISERVTYRPERAHPRRRGLAFTSSDLTIKPSVVSTTRECAYPCSSLFKAWVRLRLWKEHSSL